MGNNCIKKICCCCKSDTPNVRINNKCLERLKSDCCDNDRCMSGCCIIVLPEAQSVVQPSKVIENHYPKPEIVTIHE